MNIDRFKSSLIFQCLLFLIPINIYVIGDWLGTGIQWAFFRYQETYLGTNFIVIFKELVFIQNGNIHGKTVFSIGLWFVAGCFLLLALLCAIYAYSHNNPTILRKGAFINAGAGVLFLFALYFQYGLTFNGPAGFAIPIGVPLIFGVACLQYWGSNHPDTEPNYDDQDLEAEKNFSLLNVEFSITEKQVMVNIFILILVAIVTKLVILFLTPSVFHSFIDQYDISIYYSYANHIISGQIPYVDFTVEYPQLVFLPILLASVPLLLNNQFSTYFVAFQVLMIVFDIGTLVCTYFIALKLFGPSKAFICGLLYATAFSTAYFVLTKYDSVPTFFLMLSLFLFIYQKEVLSLVSATLGALVKWFSLLTIPYYVLYLVKNERNGDNAKKGILISAILTLIIVVPYIILNTGGFLNTYLIHIDRPAEPQSLIYYLDSIIQYFFNISPMSKLSLILLVIVEMFLLAWYYQRAEKNILVLCYYIFLSVYSFILLNNIFSPQYLVWVTPLLALFLWHSWKEITLFFSVQVLFYLEHPILYGQIYTPAKTYLIVEHTLPTAFLVFSTIKFVILFVVLVVICGQLKESEINDEGYHDRKEKTDNDKSLI